MPAPKSGIVPKRGSIPTIVCVNHATEELGVDFDRLIAALQKFLDRHFAPVWGTPARLAKAKRPRSGTWTLLFTDDPDSAKHAGWLGLHHVEGKYPFAKVFVKCARANGDDVSVAASHELAEMLVDPAINLWTVGPRGRLYAYEVCDSVEEETFLVDRIPMSNFVYPAYFELFRKPKSVQFDHRKKLKRPFEILPMGYATVRAGTKKFELPGSIPKKKKLKKEVRTDHRSEYRLALHARKPADTSSFTAVHAKKRRKKTRPARASSR